MARLQFGIKRLLIMYIDFTEKPFDMTRSNIASNVNIFNYKQIDGRKSSPFNIVENQELTNDQYEKYFSLVEKLMYTCHMHNGIGLALPQLGIFTGQLFISLDFGNRQDNILPQSIQAYFNPSYRYDNTTTEKRTEEEGCLSVKTGQPLAISRPDTIVATWYDLDTQTKTFKKREEILTGLRARVFMHEYDHLLGTSIVVKFEQQNKTKKKKKK